MNIGFYIANISPADGGIFQYSLYILRMLVKCDSVNSIYLFQSNDQHEALSEILNDRKVRAVICNGNTRIKNLMRQASEFWITRYYMRIKSPKYFLNLYKLLNPERKQLNKFNIDLLHVPRQHSPAYKLKYPVIITMHDIQHVHYPEFFTPLERVHKAIRYYITMSETDQVIVSYHHVKNDLIKYFKTKDEKISVCPVPVNDDWMTNSATSFELLKEKYHLPEVYIMTPAATWEHKNHIAVLKALNLLRGESFKVFWISTGNKTPFYEVISEKIKSLNLEDQVLFPGIVSDSDLKGLYQNTSLVVIPTLYEAGSGPLFEAMRYKKPVICSNVTSLPETIDNPEFTFNPLNIMELAGLIKRGLTDTQFIERNLENSRKRTDYFKSIDYDTAFLNTYSKATQGFIQKEID